MQNSGALSARAYQCIEQNKHSDREVNHIILPNLRLRAKLTISARAYQCIEQNKHSDWEVNHIILHNLRLRAKLTISAQFAQQVIFLYLASVGGQEIYYTKKTLRG